VLVFGALGRRQLADFGWVSAAGSLLAGGVLVLHEDYSVGLFRLVGCSEYF
jgi:hypothetical protein